MLFCTSIIGRNFKKLPETIPQALAAVGIFKVLPLRCAMFKIDHLTDIYIFFQSEDSNFGRFCSQFSGLFND